MQTSELEARFEALCRMYGLPEPVREYRFAKAVGRQSRFDFCWVDAKVAVEIEGGTWLRKGGGHTTGKGYAKDCIKYNLATALGWRVYRFTSDMLRDDPAACMEQIKRAVEG